MLRLAWFGRPDARPGVRWVSLVIVLGVAGMHGLGLLAGCGGGHGGASASSSHVPAAVDRPHAAEVMASPVVMVGHEAAAAVGGAQAEVARVGKTTASGPGGCHLLHLCLAVLAGLTLVLLLGAVAWAGPVSSSLAGVLRAAVQARGPPRPRWGPVELCVSRT